MDLDWSALSEWLHIAARWTHVLAGIMWIGQTYLFNWFERHLPEDRAPDAGPNVAGQLWMVHGGGFYFVEKQVKPEDMNRRLHWFKFESLVTWLSGVILLVVVYYLGGTLVDPMESRLSEGEAVLVSVGVLVGGWLVYDTLMSRTRLYEHDGLALVLFFGAVVALCWGLTQVFSGRAAFIHLGAMFGTIMVSNVWFRILPGQRRMIEARREGREPDMTHGARGKQRSKHNTYMSVPLVFTMISNHFPVATYGAQYNWVVLAGLVAVGWIAAHLIRNH